MKIENKILLSRFLTRSGDQAWDFAVPLILIEMFPSNMKLAFVYFFTTKLGTVLFMPYVGRVIDKLQRRNALVLGIGLQVFSVLISAFIIYYLNKNIESINFIVFIVLLVMGVVSAIGTNTMDIAVASDLVPSALTKDRLPFFNSRLRQLDLLTEVTSPIVAGLLLLITFANFQHFGFYLIVAWNVLSFYPEYVLLNQILNQHPNLNEKQVVPQLSKISFMMKLKLGWHTFIHQPVAIVIFSYALLWLTVLSPHGVILTAFLKGGWSLSEPLIGVFRALGAVFGLYATFLYPKLHRRFGVLRTGKIFISFQAVMVSLALFSFFIEGSIFQLLFLLFILLSRVGLYGFGLSETELRQISIPEDLRGEINGVASALTGLATLLIFGFGILFSSVEKFQYLVIISTFAVIFAALIFCTNRTKSPYVD
ncbi:MAG: MFS transporter [Bacteriovoracaceae bacterium]|nr:MFS transporter [Bacteriovoracaceae bacterium]